MVARRLIFAALAIVFMISFGAVGIHYLEDFTWLESIYLAIETVTTVGYGEFAPKTDSGKVFTTLFMLLGVGTVLYALTVLAQALFSRKLSKRWNQAKNREMEKLKNHYIVCGAGRVGRRIIRNLQKENLPFVIIERDRKRSAEFDEDGMHIFIADATIEENLIQAGVERAQRFGKLVCRTTRRMSMSF